MSERKHRWWHWWHGAEHVGFVGGGVADPIVRVRCRKCGETWDERVLP